MTVRMRTSFNTLELKLRQIEEARMRIDANITKLDALAVSDAIEHIDEALQYIVRMLEELAK